MDMFKGTLTALLPMMFGMHVNALLIGLSAIIGHVFPIFAGFKGGKAVATSVGVLLVYNPEFFLIAWVIFLITLYVSSMVSVASMVGFTLITVVSLFYNDPILTIVALALTIFIFSVIGATSNASKTERKTWSISACFTEKNKKKTNEDGRKVQFYF